MDSATREWQPIETAPKDGTEVDLWCEPFDAMEVGNACRMTNCMFSEHSDDVWKAYVALHGWCSIEKFWRPTHWMPVPTPPDVVG